MPKQPHRLNNPLAIYDLHADNAIITLKRAGASDAFDYHHRHGQHPMTPPIASNLARNSARSTETHVDTREWSATSFSLDKMSLYYIAKFLIRIISINGPSCE